MNIHTLGAIVLAGLIFLGGNSLHAAGKIPRHPVRFAKARSATGS